MNTIRNKTFMNEAVLLDGNHFIDCLLQDCTIEYSGGPVILERASFSGCHHLFSGQAEMTIRLLQILGMMPPGFDQWTELEGLVH